MDKTLDWGYDDLKEIMEQDPEKIPQFFMEVYECTREEADEAIQYIGYFMEEYDPEVGEEYKKELDEFMKKLGEYKDD
jgi:hypothetical protein